MQLSEMLIWWGIDTQNETLNRVGGYVGKYTLPAHAMAVGWGVLLSSWYIHRQRPSAREWVPLWLGVMFYVVVMVGYYQHETIPLTLPRDVSCADRSCQNPHNRLQWPYDTRWYFGALVIMLLVLGSYIQPKSTFVLIAAFYIFTFIVFVWMLQWDNGSLWCFVAAPLLVILNARLIRQVPSARLWT